MAEKFAFVRIDKKSMRRSFGVASINKTTGFLVKRFTLKSFCAII